MWLNRRLYSAHLRPTTETEHMPSSAASYRIIEADLENPDHQKTVLDMVCAFARDPMGQGADLRPEIRARLIDGLRRHPAVFIFIALGGKHPVGYASCFLGFSTFMARPLLNIHDFYVYEAHRGQGLGKLILRGIENKARALGCGKLTLEVQRNNQRALSLYHRFGFAEAEYDAGAGSVLFRQKKLIDGQ